MNIVNLRLAGLAVLFLCPFAASADSTVHYSDAALALTEAHVRPPYNQMDFGSRTAGQPIPVPAGFDWDLWQGPVKAREFRSGIHPAAWRGWLDYGTGLLGDWFCHNADGAVWALKLYEADTCEVEYVGEETNGTNWPLGVRVSWTFPQRGEMAPCTKRWSSGTYNDKPMPPTVDPERVASVAQHPSAYFGTKGMAVSGWWMNDTRLFALEPENALGFYFLGVAFAGRERYNDQ